MVGFLLLLLLLWAVFGSRTRHYRIEFREVEN